MSGNFYFRFYVWKSEANSAGVVANSNDRAQEHVWGRDKLTVSEAYVARLQYKGRPNQTQPQSNNIHRF